MSLLTNPQFFWFISVIASVVQVALIVGAFIGQGTSSAVGLKSWTKNPVLRLAASLLTGFGWGGVFALRQNLPPEGQMVIAVISAAAFTVLMTIMMRFLIER